MINKPILPSTTSDLPNPLSIEEPNTTHAQLPQQKEPQKMGIVALTVHIPSTTKSKPPDGVSTAPRWRTLEFRIYYIIVAVGITFMALIPMGLSSPSHPNFPYYRARLFQGWIAGRPIDNSDAQYRSFRNNVVVLAALIGLHVFTRFIYSKVTRIASANSLQSITFQLLFSFVYLFGLHGFSIIKIGIILTINYWIGKTCAGRKFGPLLTWVFNIASLFANDRYDGYRFGNIIPALAYLDGYQGIYPRWNISFNITMLRLISFNMDYFWACQEREPVARDSGSGALNDKQRQTVPHALEMYSFRNFVAYATYSPLYIAGPIITFNDFIWQHRFPAPITRTSTMAYLFRFLVSLLTMEFILHYMYVVAIKDSKAWVGYTPAEISMVGFWNLIIVWLKLLLPWRFFRLWALVDGIDPPENMVRCMANNYSTFGFWRSWHRSYNLWIIRYIYIPLSGAKNVFLNSLLVFSFVALWHDLTFRLLAWGWMVSLFILPELAARFILPASRYGSKPWYRHACAIGAVLNILMMMVANLVGFVIGMDGIKFFLGQVVGTEEGLRFLIIACCCLFVAAQLMFEYREEEMRKGIYRRC